MPFILQWRQTDAAPDLAEILHEAQATSAATVQVLHVARGGWNGYQELTHVAGTRPAGTAELLHVALAWRPASIQDAPPAPQVIYGMVPATVRVRTSLGDPVSVELSDDGTGPTGTVTLPGVITPGEGTVTAVIEVQGGDRTSTRQVVLDLDDQWEVDETRGLERTTIRAHTAAAVRLGTLRLPELVDFVRKPTPRPERGQDCQSRPEPQAMQVSAVVARAVQAAGVFLSFGPNLDPLTGEVWTEWDTPYSTAGKTPQQILDDTYFAIGWHPVIRRFGSFVQLLILPPGGSDGTLDTTGDDLLSGGTRRQESAQLPASVVMTGADLLVDLPDLGNLIQLAPDPTGFEQEILPNLQWLRSAPTPDGKGEVRTAYNKVLGQIVGVYSTTTQRLTVQEQVNGQTVTREFGRVLTSEEHTTSTYHPACRDMLLRQETVKRSWGYTVATQVRTEITGAYGFISPVPAGDPLGEETELIEQTWSPEGWLQSRIKTTRKLSSVQQANPDGDLSERGPLAPFEFLERVRFETFRPSGSGWLMEWRESGGIPVPVYDAESFDPVRLGVRGGTVTSGAEPMDAAPTRVTCPDPCSKRRRAIPNVVQIRADAGRQGTEITRSVSWTRERGTLATYARWVAADLAQRVTRTRTLIGVPPVVPGMAVQDMDGRGLRGVLQSVAVQVSSGQASTEVITHEPQPPRLSEHAHQPPQTTYRDIVLFRQVGGVTVQHFTGQFDGDAPRFENIFVRVAGTQYPNPLDELEWIDDPRYGPTATGNYGQEAL